MPGGAGFAQVIGADRLIENYTNIKFAAEMNLSHGKEFILHEAGQEKEFER
jgi:hypothetical protein